MNNQGWFPLGWVGLISLQSNRLSSLLQEHNLNASILWCSAFFRVQISHVYMAIGKIIALMIQTFVSKVMSLLFNMLYRFITAFLPRSKRLHGCSHYSQFLFDVLVLWPRGVWDLSSLTRARTCTPCIGRQSLNHWTARVVPSQEFCCEKISTAWSIPQCLPKDAILWIMVDLLAHTCLWKVVLLSLTGAMNKKPRGKTGQGRRWAGGLKRGVGDTSRWAKCHMIPSSLQHIVPLWHASGCHHQLLVDLMLSPI